MALSTTIKNKMLEVTHLRYRILVEIENEDGDWIDFTSRDPKIGTLRMSTEKRRSQIVSSIGSVSFTNDDHYFDYMDHPANLTTLATFLTLASKFLNGFCQKRIRFTLRVHLPDATYEDARLGIYRIKTGTIDHKSGRMTFALCQDVDFLKRIAPRRSQTASGTTRISRRRTSCGNCSSAFTRRGSRAPSSTCPTASIFRPSTGSPTSHTGESRPREIRRDAGETT